ncbi:peptidase S8 and S53 subtilisin kexin sedolisin [Halorubrum tropicale]|jgi:subtilisin family serine protease|uniref:Peptidase S8 and S53 subtilisin kexin sedolisin n=1 Tax=Halorubrum tropicale TaxID=1765655 RepID=A0A0M9AT46_9EURY|nr:peptidase S8 and S53 subtilisin kexin sedolisin [Halorubrum tropicale]
MHFDRRTLVKGVAGLAATATITGTASAADGRTQYIIGANGNGVADAIEAAGFEVRHELADGDVLVAVGPSDAAADIESVKGVKTANPDLKLELDEPEVDAEAAAESAPSDGAALSDLQWDKEITDVFEAHEYATGEGTRVAIVDTGIDLNHPDLGNVNKDLGRAFVVDDDVPEIGPDDSGSHGTHVAGTVGATGESSVVGTAPDTELIPIRVFPANGGASFGDILAGIDYAAEIGADAANFSLGIPGVQQPGSELNKLKAEVQTVFQSAVRRGTVITGSAGNDSGSLQGSGFTLPNSVPAAFTVSATSPADTLSFYSNFGTSDIDIAAPGGWYETIPRTLGEEGAGEPGDIPFPENGVLSTIPVEQGKYGYKSGTSMAAPQVAGLAALVRELEPNANASQVEQAIQKGAEGANGKSDSEFGAGIINALNTVERLSDRK